MKIIKELNYKILCVDEQDSFEPISIKVNHNDEQQMYIIHKALKQQLKNKRIRNAHTKTRSEVRGGGRKPWKQKGTGRARAGSNRSPLWRGGGVIFGPRKKKYTSKINKKEKRLAINNVLANKFSNTIVVKNLLTNVNKPSTKEVISKINQNGVKVTKKQKLLIILDKKNKILNLSFRNIKNVELIEVQSMNVISLLKADIIILDHSALLKINKIFV